VLSDNTEIINGLDEIKSISGWYREAKEDPNNIPILIINELMERLTEQVEPIFNTFIIDKIKIETGNCKGESKIKLIEIDLSVEPFVEYLKKVDEIECNKIRITFNISIVGRLEDITIHSDMSGRYILSISIDRGAVSSIKLVPKPVVLYHTDTFKLVNVSFNL
jgi:hypothetical protein